MTVTYTHEVSDCKGFGNFWRLLFRWRGSVYKLVWLDLLCYAVVYLTLSLVYRLALVEDQKRLFEKVVLYCNYFSDYIPVSFVLGFYVSIVIKRWWNQYLLLPWPDSLALFVSTCIHGHDRQGRLMRRTILRYINLSFVLTLTMITPRAKKRFPTLEHMVEAGFMTSNEKKVFSAMVDKSPHSLYYVPLVWAGTLVSRARREGRIRDDFAVKTIMDELNNLRVKLNGLISYDWISIPLVYTQVVSLAVYTFFLSTMLGSQYLDPLQNYPKNHVDLYVPFFTLLQFFFYMGWLKVAESLVNPFGEDDDDFEVNWLIDRNIQISYLIVDEMHNEHPELTQDLYWDEVFPQELPYTVATEQYKQNPPMGSTVNLRVPEADQEFVPMLEEVVEENEGVDGVDGMLQGKHLGSNRSFGSFMSRRKSSLLSTLQNRMRRGGDRTSLGSQGSSRKHRVRSVSQTESQLSDTSINSSVFKRNNTVTSLQESDLGQLSQESLPTEGNGEGLPGFLSSSPKAGHKKITIPSSLATITSSFASSNSSFPPNKVNFSRSPKDVDPVLLKVSNLQDEEEEGVDEAAAAAAAAAQPGTSFSSINIDNNSTASTSISDLQEREEGQTDGKEDTPSQSPPHTVPDTHQEPTHPRKSDTVEGTQEDENVHDTTPYYHIWKV